MRATPHPTQDTPKPRFPYLLHVQKSAGYPHPALLRCSPGDSDGAVKLAQVSHSASYDANAVAERLALCFNCHDELVAALSDLVGIICSMPGFTERDVTIEDCDRAKAIIAKVRSV